MTFVRKIFVPGLLSLAVACGGGSARNPIADTWPGGGKSDSSRIATILDFAWSGSVEVDGDVFDPNQTLEGLLYYTVGQLNGSRAVGRMDRVAWSNVATSSDGKRTTIRYQATMPVAWGSKTDLPERYTFKLPRRGDAFGDFTARYHDKCTDFTPDPKNPTHVVDVESMWYYYRPDREGCEIDDGDVIVSDARVTVSADNTTGKYPEYDLVWKDGALKIVAIFGKYKKGEVEDDVGIDAYDTFNQAVRRRFRRMTGFATTPAGVPASPGAAVPEVDYTATLADGRKIVVAALLVDEVSSATAEFYQRYEALSVDADVIAYNGHAGLGANIRTLAGVGKFDRGQYTIIFMNGCDTYTYIDGALAEKHAAINPDDPKGTKYMDMVVNAMPAFFMFDSASTMAIVDGLLAYDAPRTYDEIFESISTTQIVLVTGEQDNAFHP